MKASNDLYDLIQTLSKSEKRYIRLKSSFHHGDKLYLHLFDLMEGQKSYNRELVALGWEKRAKARALPQTQNYLYEFILETLEVYHSQKDDRIIVQSLLKQVNTLFDKALYKQCIKLLRKARKVAARSQMNIRLMLEIIVWELRITLSTRYGGELNRTWVDLLKEEEEILAEIAIINQARRFRFSIENGDEVSEEAFADWKQGFLPPIPPGAEIEFLRGCAVYHQSKEKYDEALMCLDAELRKLKKVYNLALDRNAFSKYVSCLELAISICLGFRNYEQGMVYIQMLNPQNVPKRLHKSVHLSTKSQTFYFIHLLYHNILSDDSDALKKALSDVESAVVGWNKGLNAVNHAKLQYLRAMAYRKVGESSKALKVLLEFMGERVQSGRERLFLDASWLAIIVHYETGNHHSVETSWEAIVRKLKQGDLKEPLDGILASFFKSIVYGQTKRDYQNAIKKLKQQLVGFYPRSMLFDYVQWAEGLEAKV